MSDYLPDWLLPEILRRLPIESLLRFRSVSKEWCSVISSPHFISTYRSITTNDLLFLSHFSKEEKYSVYFDPCSKTKNLTLFKEFKISFGNDFNIVGSCDGLFCLAEDSSRYGHAIILWNPAIRKSISLPDPSPCSTSYRPFPIGFGFDHKTHDFKVVNLERAIDAYYMFPPRVEVYKLSTGLWETIDSKGSFNRKLHFEDRSIYLNGSIHWVADGENEGGEITNSLLVFDLSDETFSEMGLPRVLATHDSELDLSVTLCGERISVILFEQDYDYDPSCVSCVVWAMNEYGKTESWTQKLVVNLDSGIDDAIGSTRNGELLVVQDPGDLVSYDPEKEEVKDLDIHGHSFFLTKYVESLVLLDRSSEATSESEEATKI